MSSIVVPTLFFSVFITIALIPLFTRMAVRFHAMDVPEPRKIHKKPVPRIGGAAMALGILVSALAFLPKDSFVIAFLVSTGTIIAFGLADDLTGLGYKSKFAGQIAAALVIISYGKVRIITLGSLIPASLCLSDWGSYLLTFLVIVGVTNAINLSDGLDGLAAGVCLLAFCCIAYLAYRAGMTTVLFLSVSMAGVIFGFLRFNTYPATVFMGDAGSQLLGFSGIVLAVKLSQESLSLSPVLPLFLFGLPILDTLAVMSQRILDGRSPFLPDRNHIHHKLMRLGLSHTEAVFSIYMVQSLLIISALFFGSSSDRLLLMGYVVFSSLILFGFFIAERHGHRFKRYDFIDQGLKKKLIRLKERGILIKFCFFVVKAGLPALLILTVFLPDHIPVNMSCLAALSIIPLAASFFFSRIAPGPVVRLVLYMFVPFLLYIAEFHAADWMISRYFQVYNMSFLVLGFFAVMTLKFTRRRKGFRFTTMDFLILVIVFAVSILPDQQVHNYHLGMLASKIIILFFSFEILAGEFRGKWACLTIAVLAICSTVVLRGVFAL